MDLGFAAGSSRLSVSAERVVYHIIYIENGPRFPGISQPAERFTYSAYGSVYSAYGSVASGECPSEPVTQLQLRPGPGLGTVALNPSLPYEGCGRCVGETYRADLHAEGGSGGSGYSVQTELDAPVVAHPGERFRFLMTMLNKRPVSSKVPAPGPTAGGRRLGCLPDVSPGTRRGRRELQLAPAKLPASEPDAAVRQGNLRDVHRRSRRRAAGPIGPLVRRGWGPGDVPTNRD